MKVSLIVAMAKNRVIGRDNKLPWSIPEDLKNFKKLTTGHTIIMGRKTYESIGRLLPERKNVIMTRSQGYKIEGARVACSPQEALESKAGEVFVIGGEEIYRQFIGRADRIYLTLIHREVDGDAVFPEFDLSCFRLISREDRIEPEAYSFLVYDRI